VSQKSNDKNAGTGFIPFLLQKDTTAPGKFQLVFFAEGVKFVYSLTIGREQVVEEKLSFYPGTQPAVLFTRRYNADNDSSVVDYGSKVKINKAVKEELAVKLLKNVSFFVAYNQVNYTQPEIEMAANWFNNQLLYTINPNIKLTRYTTGELKTNNKLKEFTVNFLKNAQYNISDIHVKTETEPLTDSALRMLEGADIPTEKKEQLLKEGVKSEHVEFEHFITNNGQNETYLLPESLQSEGTLRYYGFTGPLYKAFNNGAFLAIDEVEASLHPHLVKHLVKEFLMGCRKYPNVQLLFTTHNMVLLNDKDMLRKDAIWFTEKQENGATDLYSMADFDFRKELSYFNAYNIGKFGAIPELD
jgi:AAA15 family ATPase/GTPase